MTDTTLPDYASLAPKVLGTAVPVAPATPAAPTAEGIPDYKALAQNRTADAVRNNMQFATAANPDDEAKYRHLAQFIGAPLGAVSADPAAARSRASLLATDADRLAAQTPVTAQALTDPSNARMLHDQIPNLVATETTIQQLGHAVDYVFGSSRNAGDASMIGDVGRAVHSGVTGMAKAVNLVLGAAPVAYDAAQSALSGTPTTAAGDAYFGSMVAPAEASMRADALPPGASFGRKTVDAVGKLVPTMLAIMATGGTSAAPAADATMREFLENAASHATKSMAVPSTTSSVNTASDVLNDGGSALRAEAAATMQFITSSANGIMPLSAPGNALTRIVGGGAGFAASAEASRVAMNSVLPDNMQQAFDPDEALINAMTGGALGGAHGPRLTPDQNVMIRQTYTDAAHAELAEHAMGMLHTIGELANMGEFRNRDQGAFRQFVSDAGERSGTPDLYVDAKTFAQVLDQSGVSGQELLAHLPDVAAQMREGLQSEGMVQIPLEDYATYIAGGKLDPALLPHMRTTPEGMTFTESQAYYQDQVTSMQTQAAKIVGDKAQNDAFKASGDQVEDHIQQELAATGRFPDAVNKAYAKMHRAFFDTLAARTDTLPHEQLAQYGLGVRAEALPGAQNTLDQAAPLSVEGYHYSTAERSTLSGDQYGTGAQGSNTERFLNAADKRLRQRIYFYADKGHGILPEAGLGAVGHRATLSNLYDANSDSLRLRKDSQEAFESRVLDHGYSGYLDRLEGQGSANVIMLGKNNVKVEPLGLVGKTTGKTVPRVFERQALGRDVAVDALVARKDLPAGEVKPARWAEILKQRMPEVHDALQAAGVFDGTEPLYKSALVKKFEAATTAPVYGTGDHTVNIGLDIPGGGHVTPEEAVRALKAAGVEVTAQAVHKSDTEQTLVAHLDRPLTPDEAHAVSVALKQEAIAQISRGAGELYGPKADQWKPFNPDYFLKLDGSRARESSFSQSAFHGTPHTVDKFTTQKIGTGEGNQSYGWGMYFAGNKAVAEFYRASLARDHFTVDGKPLDETNPAHIAAATLEYNGGDRRETADHLRAEATSSYSDAAQKQVWRDAAKVLDSGVELPKVSRTDGNLYKVEIPDDSNMLDLNARLADQPESVRAALETLGFPAEAFALRGNSQGVFAQFSTLAEAREAMRTNNLDGTIARVPNTLTGSQVYDALRQRLGTPEAASKALDAAGVPGLRYADAGSRGDKAEGNTNNYVVFHDNHVSEPQRVPPGASFDQGARGQIAFGDDITKQPSIISLFHDADLSTFLHESGHFFLEVYSDLASRPDAPQDIKDDMDTLLKSFNVPDLATWRGMTNDERRESHENFARGFEHYLMEGKAPSPALQSLFGRFRAWLMNVYKSVSALRVSVSPEVRGVMDRMLASQEEIEQAQKVRGMEALLATKPEGVSDAEYTKYQELNTQATEDAISDLQSRGLRDMKWLSNAKSKAMKGLQAQAATERAAIRADVTQQVEASPAFAAKAYLDNETNPNKSHKEALTEWRANRDAQPKDARAAWVTDNPEPQRPRTSVDNWLDQRKAVEDATRTAAETKAAGDAVGIKKGQALAKAKRSINNEVERAALDWETANPRPKLERPVVDMELTAEKFGFNTADEMLAAIHDVGSKKEAIDDLVDQRMLQEHGDLIDPRSIERAAEAAVHNAARARFIATELHGLAKVVGNAGLLAKAARAAADTAIAAKRVRDLRPDQYAAAEARASRESTKAFKKGDTQTAAIQKRAQLLSNALARSATEAAAEIAKGVEYLKRFDKTSVRDRIDVDYRNQIDTILAKHDLRTSTTNRELNTRKSISDWVEEQQALGNEPNIPDDIVDEANTTHFKDMTIESFRGLVDAVKSIEHLGKAVQKIRDGNEARDFRAVVDEAMASMAALPQRDPETNRGLSSIERKWMNAKSAGRNFDSSLIKMEQVIDWLDNHESTGVFNRVVFKRIAEAQTRENDLRTVMVAKLHELAKSQPKGYGKDFDQKLTLPGLIDTKTGKTQILLKRELLAAALNSGNESNYQKLLRGERWSDTALQAAFDKHMTKADWDYVQGVLHAVNHLWPEIAAMEHRLGNTSPTKVEARPIVTPHGTYEGGYYPAVYDPLRAFDVEQNRQRAAGTGLMDNNYQKATTSKGHTKERNEDYARPFLLSLDVIPRHMTQVIHDIAYREALMDADRFLADPRVREGIENVLGREYYKQFRPWLQGLANDKVYDARGLAFWDKAAHWARTTTTMVGLGYRVSTMMIHGATATSNSIGEIGPRWMASGVSDVMGTPSKMAAARDFIFERSGEMRHRMNEVDRDVRDQLREMEAKSATGLTSAATELVNGAKRGAFYGIAMLDFASAMPTWMGAYSRGLHEGLSETDAVYAADKAVRNAHGGTGTKDLAAIQRGPEFQKLFTMFYSFWNHFYNRQRDIGRTAMQLPGKVAAGDYAGARRDFAMVLARSFFYFIVPQLLHAALKPPAAGTQDEDEGWLHWAAKEIALGMFSGVPVVRDAANAISTGRDYQPTPVVAIAKTAANTAKDIAGVLSGQGPSDKWVQHAVQTAGYVFGLPTGQASNAVQYLWDVGDGKQDPQGLADWWHGLKDGHQ